MTLDLKNAQTALKSQNLYNGAIDGSLGPKTISALLAFGASRPLDGHIQHYGQAFSDVMINRIITSPLGILHFLTQILHETQNLTKFEENLNYTNPERLDTLFSAVKGLDHARSLIKSGPQTIANCVYANRGGNGGPETGDGWTYRGRGALMLTFRDNYRDMGKKLGINLIANPDLALAPDISAKIAAQFWQDKSLGRFAQSDDLTSIRERINGPALAGLSACKLLVTRYKSLFEGQIT